MFYPEACTIEILSEQTKLISLGYPYALSAKQVLRH